MRPSYCKGKTTYEQRDTKRIKNNVQNISSRWQDIERRNKNFKQQVLPPRKISSSIPYRDHCRMMRFHCTADYRLTGQTSYSQPPLYPRISRSSDIRSSLLPTLLAAYQPCEQIIPTYESHPHALYGCL